MLPARAQDEIFGADPDARLAGIVIPGPDPATVVEGGYRVSGRWGFASGILHASWAVVPAVIMGDDGQPVDIKLLFVPIRDVTVDDTWHVLGMRGTGSNTIVANDLFVPEHRTYGLLGPSGALNGVTRTEHQDETLYRTPLGMMVGMIVLGPLLGIARATFDHVLEKLPKRPIAYSSYTKSSAAISTQLAIAEARTRLDMATMLAHRAADDCDAAGLAGGGPHSAVVGTRARNDAAFAARELKGVVEMLVRLAGASSVAEQDLMSRLYRDMSTASLHGVLQPATTLEMYGAALCGEPVVNSMLY